MQYMALAAREALSAGEAPLFSCAQHGDPRSVDLKACLYSRDCCISGIHRAGARRSQEAVHLWSVGFHLGSLGWATGRCVEVGLDTPRLGTYEVRAKAFATVSDTLGVGKARF